VTPEDPGTIGNFGGMNQPTSLSLGSYLVQEKVLAVEEGERLQQYLTS
jgi:hypothetical protein